MTEVVQASPLVDVPVSKLPLSPEKDSKISDPPVKIQEGKQGVEVKEAEKNDEAIEKNDGKQRDEKKGEAIPKDEGKNEGEDAGLLNKEKEGINDEADKKEVIMAPADVPKPQAAPLFRKKAAVTSYPYTEEVDVRYLRRLTIPMAQYPHINWRVALNGTHGVSPLTLIERESGAAILIRKNGALPQAPGPLAGTGEVPKQFGLPGPIPENTEIRRLKEPVLLGGDGIEKSPNASNIALPPTAPVSPILGKGAIGGIPQSKSPVGDGDVAIPIKPVTESAIPDVTKPEQRESKLSPVVDKQPVTPIPANGGDLATQDKGATGGLPTPKSPVGEGDMAIPIKPVTESAPTNVVKPEQGESKLSPIVDKPLSTPIPGISTPANGGALATHDLKMTPIEEIHLADYSALKQPISDVLKKFGGNADYNIDLDDEAQFKVIVEKLQEQAKIQQEQTAAGKPSNPMTFQELFRDIPRFPPTADVSAAPPKPAATTRAEQLYIDLLARHETERLRLITATATAASQPINTLEKLDEELIELIERQQLERRRAKAAIDATSNDYGLHFLILAQHSSDAEACLDRLQHLIEMIVEEGEDGWTTSDDGSEDDEEVVPLGMVQGGNKAVEAVKGDTTDAAVEVPNANPAFIVPPPTTGGKMSAVIEVSPVAVAVGAAGVEVVKDQDSKSAKDGIVDTAQKQLEGVAGVVEVQIE